MRSRHARGLAEQTLAALIVELGDHSTEITVIGGLNADLLTDPDAAAPHQGTVDVDVVLEVGFVWQRQDDLDFGWLEDGLRRAGFELPAGGDGWRWERTVGGVPVRLELLCDTWDNRGQAIALPGCTDATAMNLEGPAAALRDSTVRQVPTGDPSAPTVPVAFAGLGGYLVAKASAVVGRTVEKDLYDWMYVTLHNTAGGPRAAADAVRAIVAEMPEYEANLVAALSRFEAADSEGAVLYAAQRVRDGQADEAAVIAQDAVSAARTFRRHLWGEHGGPRP